VAGGIMTTKTVVLTLDETIRDARAKVRYRRREEDVDGPVDIDGQGRLIDDLSLIDVLDNDSDTLIAAVVGPLTPAPCCLTRIWTTWWSS
jgi:Mg/Co/Ni transporter MgtE